MLIAVITDIEIESRSFGVPFDLKLLPLYHMKPSFTPAIERVLSALHYSRHGSIHLCPLVPVLATIMLHFIDEWEVFAMLTHLMSRTSWLDQGQSQLSASVSTLQHLLHTHAVSSKDIVLYNSLFWCTVNRAYALLNLNFSI